MKISRIGEQVIIDGQGDIVYGDAGVTLDESAHHITVKNFNFFGFYPAGFGGKIRIIFQICKMVFGRRLAFRQLSQDSFVRVSQQEQKENE